ncbi:uncharacterized protein LOC133176332 [Saccostrea echinata]|uniref:uncharacterized protein LOC133176332 n=1 Tax=Saccostrea echinata TaxID=191078 RepID=UPI002A7F5544|nr:uncharacterized protein LOC133176332 [Saccostrea echinata]
MCSSKTYLITFVCIALSSFGFVIIGIFDKKWVETPNFCISVFPDSNECGAGDLTNLLLVSNWVCLLTAIFFVLTICFNWWNSDTEARKWVNGIVIVAYQLAGVLGFIGCIILLSKYSNEIRWGCVFGFIGYSLSVLQLFMICFCKCAISDNDETEREPKSDAEENYI